MAQPPIRKLDLRQHQLAAYAFASVREASLCGMGMGCGKTAVAVALADNMPAHRTLVLTPTSCRGVWRGQIPKHSGRDVDAVILDRGSVRKRAEQAGAAWNSERPIVVVVNYEAAFREPLRSWLLSRRWDFTVVDESQRVMRLSKTAQFCNELRKVSDRRLALTGTALTSDPISVWGQARFIDPRVFGHDLEAFKERYHNKYAVGTRKACVKINELWSKMYDQGRIPRDLPRTFQFPEWLGTNRTEEFLQRLSTIAFRVENTALDLPPLTIERRTFKLCDKARKFYDQIKHGYREEIKPGRWKDVRSSYAITMRLQQITSGWFPQGDKVFLLDTGKAELFDELLDEAGGEPIVVFARFVRDLDVIRALAERRGLRYGEISQRRKDGLTDIATMPEGIQVNGVQEQAGGAGIDLTLARIVCRYSPSWSVPNFDQSAARVYRPPQQKHVYVISLVAENSVDEDIHRAIEARKGIVSQVWRGLEVVSSPAPTRDTREYPSSDGSTPV